MQAIIGVDPHKATHTAVVVNDRKDELDRKKVRACRTQVTQLLCGMAGRSCSSFAW